MYYRVSALTKDWCRAFFDEKAEFAEDAIRIVKEKYGIKEGVDDIVRIDADEISIENLIEDEKRQLIGDLTTEYLFLKGARDTMTAKEYGKAYQDIEFNEENYWKMIRAVRRYYRIRNMVLKRCDISKMSACELLDAIKKLWEIEEDLRTSRSGPAEKRYGAHDDQLESVALLKGDYMLNLSRK